MKFTARKRSSSNVLNLTPLIDCMFLLVIFIMIAARFEPDAGIAVDLPTAGTTEKKAQSRPEHINVTVSGDGKIFIGQDEVASADLERRIVETRSQSSAPDDVVLVIYGDRVAHHEKVVEVMDAAQRAKQLKVIVRTKQ